MDVSNSSALGMSETEDDDNQLSKKDVSLQSHCLFVTTRNLTSTSQALKKNPCFST